MAITGATTSTSTTVLIPEIVEQMAIESAAGMKVFSPVVANKPGRNLFDITGQAGNTINVPQAAAITFSALTESTAQTFVEFVPTDRQLAAVLIGTQMSISWESRNFSALDPYAIISEEVAIADSVAEDSAATIGYAAAYTDADDASPDHRIGANGTALDAAIARQGVQLLMTAKAPRPYNWFIDPIQWAELLTDATAASLIKDSGTLPAGYAVTEGIRTDQFMGKLYGCNIWVVPGGMIESTGLFSMMVGYNCLGKAYKNVATPLSPTPSEINTDIQWQAQSRTWDVAITVCRDVGAINGTASANTWMVQIVS